RAGKMLRRRHHPQAQAAGKAEGGQEADEADRLGRGAAGSLPGHPAGRRISKLPGGPARQIHSQAMALLTSLILAAFAGYIGAWYVDAVEGNFALLLFLATLVTGAYWLAERFWFLP